MASLRPVLRVLCGVVLLGALPSMPPCAQAQGGLAEWRRLEVAGRPTEPAVAVAVSPRGEVAIASGGGVRWLPGEEGAAAERAAFDAVFDLGFGPGGALWIGGPDGLWKWERGGRPTRRRLPGVAGAVEVRRLEGSETGLAVATAAGLWWSTDGRVFQSLGAGRLAGGVDLVAFRAGAVGNSGAPTREIWLSDESGLTRIVGLATEAGLRVIERRDVALPRPRGDERPVDLVVAPGANPLILVLYPDAIATTASRSDGTSAGWKRIRPVAAPGARFARAIWTAAGLHVATDRGLFHAGDPSASWSRVGPAPGAQPCVDLDVSPRRARGEVALCRSGAFERRPREGLSALRAPSERTSPNSLLGATDSPIPADPPVAAIRVRALARAGIGVERDRALLRGLSRRGWLPEVGLQLGADLDRDERRFADESFVSGDYRSLFDRTRERATRFEAVLQLDWDFGEIAYPDDSVDLSRELRQVISLRDDVSDEIHQLYFERARVRERLAAGPPFEPGERSRLRLRAAELAAGLDAWTGGWLSAWHADRAALAGRAPEIDFIPFPGPDPGEPRE